VHPASHIQDLSLSEDGCHGVTASLDKTSKLVDLATLEVLKTYQTERFVNTAAISPLLDHVWRPWLLHTP
jgi:translation initiation factor 3 subunit I